MANHKDYRNKGIYTVSNLVELSLSYFKIDLDGSKFKNACDKLRTILKDNGIQGQNDPKQNNNTYYYKRNKEIDEIITGKEFKKYLEKITQNYNLNTRNTDRMLLEKQIESMDTLKKDREVLMKKLELSEEDTLFLDADKVTKRQYLQMDELDFLNKKGLVLRDSLNDEETENLNFHNYCKMTFESEEKEAEELFLQKKLELMITALFNQKFILDEKKLREDIGLWVHSGKTEYSTIAKLNGKIIEADMSPTKAYLGVNNPEYMYNYVHLRNE